MVPGSIFRYGSNFYKVTRRPRLSNRQPMDAPAIPFPKDETTPPVTNMYLGMSYYGCASIILVFSAITNRLGTGCKQPVNSFEIFRRVDAERFVIRFNDANSEPILERTQLLQTLRLLQR